MADAIEYGVFAGGYGPPQYQRQRFAGIKNPEVFTGKDFGIWRRRRDLNPRDGFPPYSLSRGAPSASWVSLQVECKEEKLAERVGFEPTDASTSPVFKTGSFNHSDISPRPVSGQMQKR